MKPHNYWIMFTAKGEIAADQYGAAIRVYNDANRPLRWERTWDDKNPQDAPHAAVEYTPK
jgi:hypothetical protein